MATTGSTETLEGRPKGTYRFSDRFIKRATVSIVVTAVVLIAAGVTLGIVSDSVSGRAGELLSTLGAVVAVGGVVVPLLAAAVLGGEAIKKGAGLLGLGLVLGVLSASAASMEKVATWLGGWQPTVFWAGVAVIVISCVAFLAAGWIAKVPMWFGAPMLGSPRVYIRGHSHNTADVNVTHDGEQPPKD